MSAPYLGDYAANSTLYFNWATNDVDGSSITRGTNGEVRVYKNDDGSQTTTGVTDSEDFDGLTGVHNVKLVMTDAFYATAKDYSVVLQGAVIGGKTVNAVLAQFSIQNRYGAAPAAATVAAAVWDEVITGAVHNVNNSAAKFLRNASGGQVSVIDSGTMQSGSTANTAKLATTASTVNNIYNRNLLVVTGGTGLGQTRRIVSYVGSTRVATVDYAWVVTPDNTSTYEVRASAGSTIANEGVAQSGGATSIQLATTASSVNNFYNDSFVTITSGLGSGQTRVITAYTGATRTATVDSAWSVNPDSTSVYAVIPSGANDVSGGGGATGPTTAEIAAAVWDIATSGHTTAATFGAQLKTLLDLIATYIDTEVAAIKAKTDNLPASPAATSDIPSVNAIADQVWDEALSGHTTAGTAGKQLQDISTGTAPTSSAIADAVWDEALAGHVAAGSAGAALGVTPLTADEIADAILKRDWSAISGEASRSMLNALRFLRNRWEVINNGLRVYKENDSTEAWNSVVASTAGAVPVTSSDPA